eukprot:CAMPEP_0198509644 /NCGR_PEP_ID=MMETSP1462-20131121/13689_1 /TAXON_ID=1333877 /ORGANISM="Brandtodinium nutriculum, Strain RCC3387" /LENGTH=639 /DNA_ID=CAMNT_0044238951 /DNA_START=39 /DNA_END=1955 /DNA_ORIENTATION=+
MTTQGGAEGIRRRPVPVHYDWHVAPAEEGDEQDDEDIVFEDEQPSKVQEYIGMLCDYVFWILLAYCAANLLLWICERLGLISPQFEEWMPARWWHSSPHNLQKELFANATAGAGTSAQFEGLKKWIESGPGGWVSPKLAVMDYLSERGRYERRLEVKEQVDQDEVLVRLPLSHVLSSDFCQQDLTDTTIRQVVEAKKKSSESVDISPWTWITLYMIAHSRKAASGSSSAVSWRFDSLLKAEYVDAALSYIPIFWDDDNLHWLNGTDLLNIHVLDVHAAIETEYHKLTYLVPTIQDTIPVIDFKKWAMVVMSRGETVDLPDRENKSRTVPQLAIMPLIDLVDHHLPMPETPVLTYDDLQHYQERGSHTNISYNAALAAVVLKAKKTMDSNSAVTVGYGVRSNADYLLYHGFTMPREWSDLTLCTQYSMIELPLPEDMPSWKSRFLAHPYRFAVPACPNQKATPHVIAGAARFLVATEEDVISFEERAQKDPDLTGGVAVSRDEKFLSHGAREALANVCDIATQPPLCRAPLSLESERQAWALIKSRTIARVAAHLNSVEEDERVLKEDDAKNNLSVNQRHAVIARREEKMALQRWCSIAVFISGLLEGPGAEQELTMERLPESEKLENDEPRARPRYWKR